MEPKRRGSVTAPTKRIIRIDPTKLDKNAISSLKLALSKVTGLVPVKKVVPADENAESLVQPTEPPTPSVKMVAMPPVKRLQRITPIPMLRRTKRKSTDTSQMASSKVLKVLRKRIMARATPVKDIMPVRVEEPTITERTHPKEGKTLRPEMNTDLAATPGPIDNAVSSAPSPHDFRSSPVPNVLMAPSEPSPAIVGEQSRVELPLPGVAKGTQLLDIETDVSGHGSDQTPITETLQPQNSPMTESWPTENQTQSSFPSTDFHMMNESPESVMVPASVQDRPVNLPACPTETQYGLPEQPTSPHECLTVCSAPNLITMSESVPAKNNTPIEPSVPLNPWANATGLQSQGVPLDRIESTPSTSDFKASPTETRSEAKRGDATRFIILSNVQVNGLKLEDLGVPATMLLPSNSQLPDLHTLCQQSAARKCGSTDDSEEGDFLGFEDETLSEPVPWIMDQCSMPAQQQVSPVAPDVREPEEVQCPPYSPLSAGGGEAYNYEYGQRSEEQHGLAAQQSVQEQLNYHMTESVAGGNSYKSETLNDEEQLGASTMPSSAERDSGTNYFPYPLDGRDKRKCAPAPHSVAPINLGPVQNTKPELAQIDDPIGDSFPPARQPVERESFGFQTPRRTTLLLNKSVLLQHLGLEVDNAMESSDEDGDSEEPITISKKMFDRYFDKKRLMNDLLERRLSKANNSRTGEERASEEKAEASVCLSEQSIVELESQTVSRDEIEDVTDDRADTSHHEESMNASDRSEESVIGSDAIPVTETESSNWNESEQPLAVLEESVERCDNVVAMNMPEICDRPIVPGTAETPELLERLEEKAQNEAMERTVSVTVEIGTCSMPGDLGGDALKTEAYRSQIELPAEDALDAIVFDFPESIQVYDDRRPASIIEGDEDGIDGDHSAIETGKEEVVADKAVPMKEEVVAVEAVAIEEEVVAHESVYIEEEPSREQAIEEPVTNPREDREVASPRRRLSRSSRNKQSREKEKDPKSHPNADDESLATTALADEEKLHAIERTAEEKALTEPAMRSTRKPRPKLVARVINRRKKKPVVETEEVTEKSICDEIRDESVPLETVPGHENNLCDPAKETSTERPQASGAQIEALSSSIRVEEVCDHSEIEDHPPSAGGGATAETKDMTTVKEETVTKAETDALVEPAETSPEEGNRGKRKAKRGRPSTKSNENRMKKEHLKTVPEPVVVIEGAVEPAQSSESSSISNTLITRRRSRAVNRPLMQEEFNIESKTTVAVTLEEEQLQSPGRRRSKSASVNAVPEEPVATAKETTSARNGRAKAVKRKRSPKSSPRKQAPPAKKAVQKRLTDFLKPEPQTERTIAAAQKSLVCGNCKEEVPSSKWQQHLFHHNGLAWREGIDDGFDLTIERVVLNKMNLFMKKHHLKEVTCSKCSTEKRKSALGIIAHMKVCGLTDEQREELKVTCEHCSARMHSQCLYSHYLYCAVLQEKRTRPPTASTSAESVEPEPESVLSKTGRVKRESSKNKELYQEISYAKYLDSSKHTSASEYTCPGCDCFKTRKRQSMKIHLRSCREPMKPAFKCTLCPFTSLDRSQMTDHIRETHAEHKQQQPDDKEAFEPSDSDASMASEASESEEDGSSGVDENEEEADEHLDDSEDEENDGQVRKRGKTSRKKKKKEEPHKTEARARGVSFWKKANENTPPSMLERRKIMEETNFSKEPLFEEWPSLEAAALQSTPMDESVVARQSSVIADDSVAINCGYLIERACWIPFPATYEGGQMLAIVCKPKDLPVMRIVHREPKETLVQVWTVGSAPLSAEASLVYSVKFTNGPVLDIAFCPSGGYAPHLNRLALMASTSVHGNVLVSALPLESPLTRGRVLEVPPSVTLLCHTIDPMSTHVVWDAWAPRHWRIIAALMNGTILIWKLDTTSILLRVGNNIEALIRIRPFITHLRSMSLNWDYLLMHTFDDEMKLYDLRADGQPREVWNDHRTNVTMLEWVPHSALMIRAATLRGGLIYVTLMHPFDLIERTHLFSAKSEVIAMGASPWTGSILFGTAAGELVLCTDESWVEIVPQRPSRLVGLVRDDNQELVGKHEKYKSREEDLSKWKMIPSAPKCIGFNGDFRHKDLYFVCAENGKVWVRKCK